VRQGEGERKFNEAKKKKKEKHEGGRGMLFDE
jgi:hypothetical protein